MRRARLSVPLALVCSLALLGGCRPGTALHSRYSNFRAYYNAYYNAERKLNEGEESLDQADRPVDRTRLVELFPRASGQGGTTGPFQEAIDKSAELLRDRPTSKWADDALLIIGKAYFYQNNFVGAEQKFRETAAAAEARDEARLAAEARFWLGRTLAAAERYDEGVQVLQEATTRPDADRRWRGRLALALGELYARAGRWDVAAEALREGAEAVDDRDLAARGYLLLGQVEENAEDWQAAADAYARADARAGTYETRYAARLGRALVLGIDAGRSDEALAVIRRMRRDDKNYQRRSEVELVYARLLAAAGETRDAQDRFRAVLYDRDLAGGSIRGQAHYRFAQFHRDVRDDYVLAAAHFDSSATLLRGQALRPGERAARAAVLDASATAQTYTGVASTLRRIGEVDSLLALGALSDEAFAARIEAIEAERLRVFREERRRERRLQDQQAFGGSAGGFVPNSRGAGRENTSDSDAGQTAGAGIGGGIPTGGAEAGFLSFRDPTSVQSGRIAFVQRWGDRPRVPNWRRRAAVEASAIASSDGGVSGDPSLSDATESGLRPLDLSPVPRTPEKRDELNVELAGLRYELGNAYFLSIGLPERAATLYRQILDESPGSVAAVRARYALAEIESAEGRDAEARALYREVADNADVPELALAARIRLGEELPEPEVVDTSAEYDAIRARWLAGDPVGAAAAFVAAADAAPEAPNAPRMYVAAASAFAQSVRGDTTALLAPLPDALVSAVLFPPADSASAAPADASSDAPDEGALEDGAPSGDAGAEGADPDAPSAFDDTPEADASDADAPDADGPSGQAPPRVRDLIRAGVTDSSAAAPAQAQPPVAVSPGAAAPRLGDHLAAVASRYPGTVAAEKATALRNALPVERAPEPVQDAPEPAGEVDPYEGEPLYGYEGPRPVDLERGGWTWQTQRVPALAAAQATARAYEQLGFRAAALGHADGTFVVVVGQFASQRAAANDLEGDPEGLEVEDVEVVPLDGLLDPSQDAGDAAPDETDPSAEDEAGDADGSNDAGDKDAAEDDAADEADAPPPAPTFGLRGDAPILPAAGGFTWRLRSTGSPVELYGVSELLRRQGVRGGTLTVEDTVWLVVGQFETREAAEAVRESLPEVAQGEEPQVVPLAPDTARPDSAPPAAGDF